MSIHETVVHSQCIEGENLSGGIRSDWLSGTLTFRAMEDLTCDYTEHRGSVSLYFFHSFTSRNHVLV